MAADSGVWLALISGACGWRLWVSVSAVLCVPLYGYTCVCVDSWLVEPVSVHVTGCWLACVDITGCWLGGVCEYHWLLAGLCVCVPLAAGWVVCMCATGCRLGCV